MKKKSVTINDLALIVQAGFQDMHERFEGVASKADMKQVISRLDHMEKVLVNHEGRIFRLEEALTPRRD